MALARKNGKIIWIDDHITDEFFVGRVVYVKLEQEDGSVVDAKFRPGEVKVGPAFLAPYISPAIGDVVEFGWDYQHFNGHIEKKVEDADRSTDYTALPVRKGGFDSKTLRDSLNSPGSKGDALIDFLGDLINSEEDDSEETG